VESEPGRVNTNARAVSDKKQVAGQTDDFQVGVECQSDGVPAESQGPGEDQHERAGQANTGKADHGHPPERVAADRMPDSHRHSLRDAQREHERYRGARAGDLVGGQGNRADPPHHEGAEIKRGNLSQVLKGHGRPKAEQPAEQTSIPSGGQKRSPAFTA
jgi:hypothetical protein